MNKTGCFKEQSGSTVYFWCGLDVLLSLTQQNSDMRSYINFIYKLRLMIKVNRNETHTVYEYIDDAK